MHEEVDQMLAVQRCFEGPGVTGDCFIVKLNIYRMNTVEQWGGKKKNTFFTNNAMPVIRKTCV